MLISPKGTEKKGTPVVGFAILSNNGRCQDNPTGKEDDMVLATASYVSSDRDDGDNEEYLYREECDVKPPSLF